MAQMCSFCNKFALDTPISTSDPFITSINCPVMFFLLVIFKSFFFVSFTSVRFLCNTPLLSQTTICSNPYACSNFVIATPAAPAPLTTILTCSFFLRPVTRIAFISPAKTTTAVPCWSSCITGISNSFLSRSSISKHRGAEMSSRLMAANDGAIFLIVAIISSVSCVSSTIGIELSPANSFNNTDFPSMTGIDAFAPKFPRPKTADPSDMMATVFPAETRSLYFD